MATPITVSAFRNIVESSLNKVFDEVYDTHMGNEQYMVEVNFEENTISIPAVRSDNDC